MYAQRFIFSTCRECTDMWDAKGSPPPCKRVIGMGPQGLIAVRKDEIGGRGVPCCPCIISYEELLTYATGGAGGVRMNTEAQALMKVIHKRMQDDTAKRYVNDPTFIGFLENGTSHNNYTGYLVVSPPDVTPELSGWWHFVRRLSDSELTQLNEFRAVNALDADWNDWESKFSAVWGMAKPKVLQKGMGQLTAMFTDPAAMAVMIGSIAVMFGPQGVLLGAFRTILVLVGVGSQAYQLFDEFKDFASLTYYANKPDDLNRAADKLADFLATLCGLGLLLILGKGVSKWQEAKFKATSGKPVEEPGAPAAPKPGGGGSKPGELKDYQPDPKWRSELPPDVREIADGISKESGMQPFHIGDWSRLCRENNWFAAIRTGKVRGLRLHFDEMTAAAKSVLVKWKTAEADGMIHRTPELNIDSIYEKDLPQQWAYRNGVPAPHTPAELAEFKVKYKAQLEAWKSQNKLAWVQNPEGPGEVLTHNGRIICSDYDKMGIYESANGKWQPQQRWYSNNDDPQLQTYINRYVRGSQMDQHGCQDFSGGPGGKPLRQPSPDEKFIVFEPPDGRPRIIKSVGELKALYKKYGLPWPYDS